MFLLRLGPGALFFSSFLSAFLHHAAATFVNRTIDDTYGDSVTGRIPIYQPASIWKNQSCTDCPIRPLARNTFSDSYTAATYTPDIGNMNITIPFNGTGIYVFFTLANGLGSGVVTKTAANFTLDNEPPKLFQHDPSTDSDVLYNQIVYSQAGLANTPHQLVISTEGNSDLYVNFDWAEYTHGEGNDAIVIFPSLASPHGTNPTSFPQPTNNSNVTNTDTGDDNTQPPPIGAIFGGAVGGLLLVLLLVVLFVFRRRRRHSRKSMESRGTYVPPLMVEIPSSDEEAGNSGNPFRTPRHSQDDSNASPSVTLVPPSPSGPESGYGYTQRGPKYGKGNSSSTPSTPALSRIDTNLRSAVPLHSVTSGDHISPFTVNAQPIPSTKSGKTKDIEAIRRSRQQELDRRLRSVQEEMAHLTGEKPTRPQPRPGQSNAPNQPAVEGSGGGEMSMEEMTDQLHQMKDQISRLRQQQRSSWAQGLSDDAPPGYTPMQPNFN